MTIYIVWSYDDGILGAFVKKQSAKDLIKEYHSKGFYHKEDMMVKEEVLIDK